MTSLRRFVRRAVPAAARRRARQLRRILRDRLTAVTFADARGDPAEFPHHVSSYARPLIRYPGQEAQFAAKRGNCARALACIDRLVVAPGETFSFWRCVGRPIHRRGYAPAAAIKDSVLTQDVGGAICLASTVLYNAALLSAMTITERWCHSADSYGARRYFELGRDAAVEYAYRDLRFRNDLCAPVMLRTKAHDDCVVAEAWLPAAMALSVTIEVDPPEYAEPPLITTVDRRLAAGVRVEDTPGLAGVRVRTRRTSNVDGATRIDDLGWSTHLAQPRRERVGPH